MDGIQRKFQTVGYAQFIENIMQMIFYRLFADEKFLADLTIPETLRHQLHDFLLAVAQQRFFPPLPRFRGLLESINHFRRQILCGCSSPADRWPTASAPRPAPPVSSHEPRRGHLPPPSAR